MIAPEAILSTAEQLENDKFIVVQYLPAGKEGGYGYIQISNQITMMKTQRLNRLKKVLRTVRNDIKDVYVL